MRELQDPQDGAQPIERALAEQPADDLARRRTDLPGSLHAARRCRQEPGHLRGREMIGIRQSLSATCGARVRGHELVLMKHPHARVGRAHPEPLADQPMRGGIEGVVEHDVTVGMELRLLPRRQRVRRRRQGQE